MMVLNTPASIKMFRLYALRQALILEIKGLRRHGRSAYKIIKEEFGLKGNKQKVLDQFTELLINLEKQMELDLG